MGISAASGVPALRPGVCTSTTRPASPFEGQMIYETDTDKMHVYNGSAWRYMLTPQSLEPGIYSDISSTQTFTGFTKGNATVVSKYAQVGKLVHFWGMVTVGSTSSMSGPLDVALPVTADGNIVTNNSACSFYNGSTLYWGMALHISLGSIRLVAMNSSSTYAYNTDITATIPFTWATNTYFYWNHTYQAA